MGNWRSVDIEGKIAPEDLGAARGFVNVGEDWGRFHCLCNAGFSLCGLGDWVREEVSTTGNLSGRDYSIQDIAQTLAEMQTRVPSLELKVHCGGDWEDSKCVNTITVRPGAKVRVGAPEKETVGENIGMIGAFRLGGMLGNF